MRLGPQSLRVMTSGFTLPGSHLPPSSQRKLYPTVDFYSGLVYRAMGFPPQVRVAGVAEGT